jgi:hypothetical protein
MQAVLEIELAAPADDVREQVTVEGGVCSQHTVQVKHVLSRDQLVKPHWPGRYLCPFAPGPGMVRIGPPVPDLLEDHGMSLEEYAARRLVLRLTALSPGSWRHQGLRVDKLAGGGFA